MKALICGQELKAEENMATVCTRGRTVNRLNELVCEKHEPSIRCFLHQCTISLGKFVTFFNWSHNSAIVLFIAQMLANGSNATWDEEFRTACFTLMGNAMMHQRQWPLQLMNIFCPVTSCLTASISFSSVSFIVWINDAAPANRMQAMRYVVLEQLSRRVSRSIAW